MSQKRAATTIVCSEYQKLLDESKRAKEIWEQHRAEICGPHLFGKEAGDELLRLQATYGLTWREYESRATSLLHKHLNTCLRCQLISRIAMGTKEDLRIGACQSDSTLSPVSH